MLKKSSNYINFISILILIYLAFIPLKPHNIKEDAILNGPFLMKNAIDHVKYISNQPHYVGSQNQQRVKSYIMQQLQSMGLEVLIQKRNVSNKYHTFIQVENIIAKIKGSDKSEDAQSLLVMSHYDSAPYSSYGASDAGAGVAVVLEGIRSFLSQNIQPKNDIIILISDAEEIGLLGAKAFAEKHSWAKNIGAVLNFEARGTAGSSYMFMETNSGNKGLLQAFKNADVQLAQSHSLAYSIYKMLPNDTDLTIFRESLNTVGFNFAFIDNHFNYHTQLDNAENLSFDSLAHHALYLMPMLNHLSQIDLASLKTDKDVVYFQVPFWKTIEYPFDSTLMISILMLLIFLIVVSLGLKNKKIHLKSIAMGGLPLLKSIIISALVSFALLKFIYWLHPHYSEILQGFPYNGNIYNGFFSLLTISICYFFYRRVIEKYSAAELMVLPIFLWILMTVFLAQSLTGAHFFIIIPILGTIALSINMFSNKNQGSVTLILFAPIILIFTPIIALLPVALGVMSIPFSGILLAMIFCVFITSFTLLKQYQLTKWVFVIPLIVIYIYSETQASFSSKRPLPNSLYYLQDNNSNQAYLFSNDNKMDDWSIQYLNTNQLNPTELNEFTQNHWRGANIVATTENKNIPVAQVEVLKNRNYSDKHIYQLKITPQRIINRMNLVNNSEINLLKLAINKEVVYEGSTKTIKANRQLATIYQKSEHYFIVDIELASGESLDFNLIEMTPHLTQSIKFNIDQRPDEYIPKPFIYSDSIITKQTFTYQ
ncbi:MAG: M20/M25/M40 family metallo-hydrolase [Marinicellaceae bacterium]